MANLIMWNLVTLDGYVEAPGRDISWLNDFWGEDLERFSIEQGEAAGGLVFGRVTYELMAGHWPGAEGTIADFMNRLPKYVFSRTLSQAAWNNTHLFSADVPGTVARLKREASKDLYLFGSARLAQALLLHGLIDEFRIGVCPLLLGAGTPLFPAGGPAASLRLLRSDALANGVVINRYAGARQEANA